ncbi:MAG: hypothetical protein VX528_03370 [Candidatus Latescibacterota bacterium]|nr:hypothetical protein [Candidatus Latescibacterota bacterium]
MSMHVITPAEALAHAEHEGMTATADFWRDHQDLMQRLHVGEEFWADKVAQLKREGSYLEAAAICREARPVPAAYRDLLICLRRLFKDSDQKDALLREIYASAVEAAVLHHEPYIEYTDNGRQTGCPGFNAAALLFKEFQQQPPEIRYDDIGVEHVDWLNKTDKSRLNKAWGEPKAHRDPFEVFREDWDRAVAEWIDGEADRRQEQERALAKLLKAPPPSKARRKRFFGLFG